MPFHYLVTNKENVESTLVEASSPAVAISHVAGESFEAQRVDGPVLAMLKKTHEVVKAGRGASATGDEPPAGDLLTGDEPAKDSGKK